MTTGDYVLAADVSELGPGDMKVVDVHGARVAIGNVAGAYVAFGNECTHDGGPLVEGQLDGDVVTCPWHFSRFCVRSGRVVDSPAEDPIPVYDVKVEGTSIFVGVPR